MKTREQIEEKYKWRLEDIYADNQQWEEEYEKVERELPGLEKLKDTITGSAQALANGLKKIDEIALLLERLYVYSRMRRDENNARGQYQAMFDRAQSLNVKVSSAVSFLNPLLLSMDEGTLLRYISECRELDDYAFIDRKSVV